jgi:hypothetical protein
MNNIVKIVADIENFKFASDGTPLKIESGYFDVRDAGFNSANQQSQINFFKILLDLFSEIPISPELEERLPLSILFQLNEKPHWTLTPNRKQLRFWSGPHGHVSSGHVDSGSAKGKYIFGLKVADGSDKYLIQTTLLFY